MAEIGAHTHPLSGKQVAVTGASGMLGSELVRQLAATGCSIRLVVRDARRVNALPETLPAHPVPEVIECELVNPIELREAFTGIDVVFHCAAQVSFDSNQNLVGINTDMAHHVVNACLDAKVERLIHVSSIAALGEPNDFGFIDADSYPDSVTGWSQYSLSKFYSENEVWRGIRSGLDAVIVNPSVILGPGDWKGKGSAALYARLASGLPFYIPGVNGYVDLRDVAAAMIGLATADGVTGKRFILNGANLSYKELITMAARSVGKRAPRWNLGEHGLNRARKASFLWAKITRSEPALTEGVVKAALGESRYDGGAIHKATGFTYRPIEQTLQDMAAAYLKYRQQMSKHARTKR